jgi:hypothetical protein
MGYRLVPLEGFLFQFTVGLAWQALAALRALATLPASVSGPVECWAFARLIPEPEFMFMV